MITLDDYVLTNLSLREHCFTIRLKDNIEYIVYHKKPRGQKTIYFIEKDGKEIILDVAPMIKNGRTMVPIRFISEALGYEVEWDALTREVIIKK